jgi:hypothetical protein
MKTDENNDYTTLTVIGRAWGLTSQDVGNHLRKHGYRDGDKPTQKAFSEELARLLMRNGFPNYSWNRTAVDQFLTKIGLSPRKPLPNPDRLVLVTPLVF